MQTDKIFYSLFQSFPSIFFAIIGDTTVNVNAYEFVSVEVKETAFRIDGVFVPTNESIDQPLYFVEVQFQLDSVFYRRFFAEIFVYLRQNQSVNHWRAVVIYPQRSLEPSDRLPYELLLNSPQVQCIYLDELGTTDNSLQIAIVKLIIEKEETAIDKGKELILQARQQLADEATKKQIVELIETILLYKFTRLSREELEKMLGIDEEFKKTRMYQSIKQDGLEEGRQEGRQEAKLEAVPRLLSLGLSVEQIATALDLTVEQVQQVAENQSG
ncbi:MAG: Rpn family recombination-promoting nuclease/putative transposase [Nostoc sp. ZfuVER08]|uniref:Rpn family recombination-promoting nuclease/putative transposase n=1 Tax=Nostoc punctiforme FACHB-252 TaxID=1357509 RepID=A0ABR8HD65_NOSPU|nr:Rpn family recombination-promoting nuclease/putative transposase [Nostoc punctiforme]MBD2613033.1 Rpn family recombination-promoting nuclease/putative transposase [Nostoc punctiforme FACHB-252]MDZ8014675.1 Rpn family recombination-promoting nuclease/putative transposase [Nostoc sp. ZfuVER08]